MALSFTLRRGYSVALSGAPEQTVHDAPPIAAAALLGTDTPGMRARLEVAVGDPVAVGQILYRDRAHPKVAFASPVSGRVAGIDFGPRHALSALRLTTGDGAPDLDPIPDTARAGDLRTLLLDSGLWPAFRSRPFGRIPDPAAQPAAIFVTAIDTHPLAPEPARVLGGSEEAFERGLAALTDLTDGPVYLCQAPGAPLTAPPKGVEVATFAGPHPAGLAGTHLLCLRMGRPEAPVWTIGYQDVVAIGHLRKTGLYHPDRVISLAGPRVARPRLLRTVMGASLRDLTEGEILPSPEDRPARLLAGSILSGRDAAYLGRATAQVTVLDGPRPVRRGRLATWLLEHRRASGPLPILPTEALERAAPPGIAPVPLLRALAVGDSEAAQRLGAAGLIEEDVALLSSLCTSQSDFGPLLRRALNDIEASG